MVREAVGRGPAFGSLLLNWENLEWGSMQYALADTGSCTRSEAKGKPTLTTRLQQEVGSPLFQAPTRRRKLDD
jgi:hypothetical protein